MRNNYFVLILAAPVDKSGMSTNVSWDKYIDLATVHFLKKLGYQRK